MMERPCAPIAIEKSKEPKDFKLPNYPLLVVSNADDAGISTGGSQTALQDLSQYWAPHMWQGALLILSIEDVPYFTFITDNTEQQLTFPQFPSRVQISQNRYAIKSFGPAAPTVTKTATLILNLAALSSSNHQHTRQLRGYRHDIRSIQPGYHCWLQVQRCRGGRHQGPRAHVLRRRQLRHGGLGHLDAGLYGRCHHSTDEGLRHVAGIRQGAH